MRKITVNILISLFAFHLISISSFAEENLKETEFNMFTGVFDFSDDKQKAGLVGLQHQDEELYRNSFIGRLSPITGGFLTENSYYNYGSGKDLGFPLEFKSEVQMTFNLSETTHLGMSYNHISNASLGSKNPGANSYMFNFLKQF